MSLCFRFDFLFFSFFSFHSDSSGYDRCLPEICVRVATYAEVPIVYFSPEKYAIASAFVIPAPFSAAMNNKKESSQFH